MAVHRHFTSLTLLQNDVASEKAIPFSIVVSSSLRFHQQATVGNIFLSEQKIAKVYYVYGFVYSTVTP